MTKPFAVAPEVPKDRVEALRRAVAMAFADPQFAEDAKRSQLDLSPSTGEQVAQIVQELMGTPPPTVARLREILK